MRYQVTITLSRPVMPPYAEWLAPHVEHMLALQNANGDALFSSAKIAESENQFTVTYQTTSESFSYYEATYASQMRNAFKETYGEQLDAFAFERTTD